VTVTIVDYGIGNLGAIPNMLRRAGVAAEITSDPERVEQAERLILPGVGAYDAGIRQLRASGLETVLTRKVIEEGTPLLGLCLGMELLSESSEEGDLPGLGWIPGHVVRFRLAPDSGLRVPHMGWNTVEPSEGARDGVDDVLRGARFYFAHSYHFAPADPSHVVGTTTYGYPFASVIRRDNVLGVQFHPEKSHRFGKALLEWYAKG
jgi:glutamine amidotransferase